MTHGSRRLFADTWRAALRREGDHYVLNGEKTFITSGMRADFYTVGESHVRCPTRALAQGLPMCHHP